MMRENNAKDHNPFSSLSVSPFFWWKSAQGWWTTSESITTVRYVGGRKQSKTQGKDRSSFFRSGFFRACVWSQLEMRRRKRSAPLCLLLYGGLCVHIAVARHSIYNVSRTIRERCSIPSRASYLQKKQGRAEEREMTDFLELLCAPCAAAPKKSITIAWLISVVLTTITFIISCIVAARVSKDNIAAGFAIGKVVVVMGIVLRYCRFHLRQNNHLFHTVWTSILCIALSVGGTLVMRKVNGSEYDLIVEVASKGVSVKPFLHIYPNPSIRHQSL